MLGKFFTHLFVEFKWLGILVIILAVLSIPCAYFGFTWGEEAAKVLLSGSEMVQLERVYSVLKHETGIFLLTSALWMWIINILILLLVILRFPGAILDSLLKSISHLKFLKKHQ